MKKIKLAAALLSMTLASASLPLCANAEEKVTHTVTFLDFDGNVYKTLNVAEGEKINYSKVSGASLDDNPDNYTKRVFTQWSSTPETAAEDIQIKALCCTETLNFDETYDKNHKLNLKQRYVYLTDELSLDGLKATLTFETQLPELDEEGNFKVEKEVTDISKGCTTQPATLAAAFSSVDPAKDEFATADIKVFAQGESKELFTYTIYYVKKLGDVNHNGGVTTADVSYVLKTCANLSKHSEETTLSDDMLLYGDINGDSKITTSDASLMLKYCAAAASPKGADWNKITQIK